VAKSNVTALPVLNHTVDASGVLENLALVEGALTAAYQTIMHSGCGDEDVVAAHRSIDLARDYLKGR
jgi:hypothetical protein